MPRPECRYCPSHCNDGGDDHECNCRCHDAQSAYDTGHAEGHAAGITVERERWRAAVADAARLLRIAADVDFERGFEAEARAGRECADKLDALIRGGT
jgi:hypothetical protein